MEWKQRNGSIISWSRYDTPVSPSYLQAAPIIHFNLRYTTTCNHDMPKEREKKGQACLNLHSRELTFSLMILYCTHVVINAIDP